MILRALLLSLLLIPAGIAEAQVRLDTLFTRPVGPGMSHTHIVEYNVPWNIHVLEVELDNPFLEIQAELGLGRYSGFERIVDMARRVDEEGERVIGAINADFFSGVGPVSMHIGGGEIARRELSGRPSLGFTADNRPYLGVPVFSGSVGNGETSITLNGVNQTRGTNQTILYNRHWTSTTGTGAGGTEVVVTVPDGWFVNDTLRTVVEEVRTGAGDSAIEPGTAVISASGSAATALQGLAQVGDTLNLFLGALPGPDQLTELVSGQPYLVADGEIEVGPRGDAIDRHPRTAVGINADSTLLYLVTVDGRQAISDGMDLYELASLMVDIGVHTGINLDGGGSTTLVIRGDMANRSSDGGMGRTVANGLLFKSTAPEGALEAIRLPYDTFKIFRGHTASFSVEGIDEYYNPMPYDTSALVFEIDAEVGSIDQAGNLVAGSAADTGFVYVRLGEMVDTMRVIVKDVGRVSISPREVVTDTSRSLTFRATSRDSDGILQSLPADAFDWEVLDTSIGEISEEGVFRGFQMGTTEVVLSYGAIADTAVVTIELGEGVIQLDDFETLDAWTAEMVNLRSDGTMLDIVEVDERSSILQIDYEFLYGEGGTTHQLLLQTDQLLYGVPDSIHLEVLSDGRRHRIFFLFEDNAGTSFQVYVPQFVQESEFYDDLSTGIARSGMVHPIRLTTIGVMLGTDNVQGQPDIGTLYIDNLRVSYVDQSSVDAEIGGNLPESFILHQNYPNPFNPSTTIRYELPSSAHITLKVYNVLGQLVDTIVDAEQASGTHEVTWTADPQTASGLYFYTFEADGQRLSRSMMLLK